MGRKSFVGRSLRYCRHSLLSIQYSYHNDRLLHCELCVGCSFQHLGLPNRNVTSGIIAFLKSIVRVHSANRKSFRRSNIISIFVSIHYAYSSNILVLRKHSVAYRMVYNSVYTASQRISLTPGPIHG